jgi:PKD repeat protein/plastocyanin
VCQLSATSAITAGCNENGMVDVQVSVSDIGGSEQGFNVLIDGNLWAGGPFVYDASGMTSIIISIPGDGQSHSISVQDVADGACISGTSISVPDCSEGCQLFGPSVDFGTAIVHTIEVRDFEFFPQAIDIKVGDTVRFIWTGVVAHTSTSDAETGISSWDSGLLNTGATFDVIITETGIHPYYCIPHGAPGGIGMAGTITASADCNNDQVQALLSFQAGGVSGTGYNVFIDANLLNGSPFNYVDQPEQSMTILVPGDGQSHNILIQDVDMESCSTSVIVVTPDCNASICQIQISTVVSGPCNVIYLVPVDIEVVSSGSGESGFNLLVDGIIDPGSPYSYATNDTTSISILLPADGQTHSIFIFDLSDVSCTATSVLTTPNCSETCSITNLRLLSGGASIHHVEVRDFEFFPKDIQVLVGDTIRFTWTGVIPHTSTSDVMSGPDHWDSGLLGEGSMFELVIQTPGFHPYYCVPHGTPGGVGMAGSITVVEPCVNQMLQGTVCFDHSGQSISGFQVLIDGLIVPGGPFAYNPGGSTCQALIFPADGMNHQVQIQDVEQLDCQLDTMIFFPDCEDPCFGFEAQFGFAIDQIALSVVFSNQSSIEADSFYWSFGDGTSSTDMNPFHAYDVAGTYDVCLESFQNGICADTVCSSIYVGEYVCEAAFIFESNGLAVNFINTSASTDSIESIQWTLGDGTVINESTQVLHQYGDLGVYTVCLTIQADTCIRTICQTIDLSNACNILSSDFGLSVEGGTIQFSDQSTGNVQSWLWGFGDGITSSEENPSHMYNASGEYTVCLLVFDFENNCSDFKCIDVSIVLTSVEGPKAKSLLLYPNPTSNEGSRVQVLGLDEAEISADLNFRFVDLSGRQITSVEWERTDTDKIEFSWREQIAAGPYIIQVISKERTYIGKLIIQN